MVTSCRLKLECCLYHDPLCTMQIFKALEEGHIKDSLRRRTHFSTWMEGCHLEYHEKAVLHGVREKLSAMKQCLANVRQAKMFLPLSWEGFKTMLSTRCSFYKIALRRLALKTPLVS